MTGKTHLGGGILASVLLCDSFASAILIIFGSILPDIDHKNSFLGKNIPFISNFFTHRGFTHSLLFVCLIWFLNVYIAYGIIVHILFDMMTHNGIKLFYPIDSNIRFPLAKYVSTDGLFEYILFIIMYIIIGFLIIRNYFI